MDLTNSIISISGGLFAGIVLGYIILSYSLKNKHKSQIKKAALEAENIKKDKIIQAKEKFLELKEKHEQIIATRERKMQEKEINHKQKENSLNKRFDDIKKAEKASINDQANLDRQIEIIQSKKQELDSLTTKQVEILEKASGFNAEEAKNQLIETLKDEAKTKAMSYIKEIQDEAKLNASKDAKKILIQSIQRIAAEQTIENAVSVFNIESDDMKGRIIG